MATYKSPEDVKREFIERMGAECGRYFHALYEEVAWLKDKWREFRQLYGTSEARVDLLNEAAPYFFGALHDTFFESILLNLSRLTDRAEMGKKENLSIRGFAATIAEPSLRAEVEQLVSNAVEKCEFARDWRNRHIAHRDRALALDDNAIALAFASRATVEAAIASLVTLVEVVHERCLDGAVSLEIPGSPGDALSLLRVLQEGVAAERARMERFRTGYTLEEDLTPRPAI